MFCALDVVFAFVAMVMDLGHESDLTMKVEIFTERVILVLLCQDWVDGCPPRTSSSHAYVSFIYQSKSNAH